MPIADLYNIPGTDEEMKRWSFAHAAHHRDMIDAARAQKRVSLAQYILDPINLSSSDAFFNQHQTMHNDINGLFRVQGFDLTSVNWSDRGQRDSWIWLNALQHQLEAKATGVY